MEKVNIGSCVQSAGGSWCSKSLLCIALVTMLCSFAIPDHAGAWVGLARSFFGVAAKGASKLGPLVKQIKQRPSVFRPKIPKLGGQEGKRPVSTALPKQEPKSTAANKSFRSTTCSFSGKTVVKRNETFDPAHKDALGRTNVERMRRRLAPIGKDGSPVHLHHEGQKENGRLIELTASEHKRIPVEKNPSEIDRAAFDKWRGDYWRDRAKEFGG